MCKGTRTAGIASCSQNEVGTGMDVRSNIYVYIHGWMKYDIALVCKMLKLAAFSQPSRKKDETGESALRPAFLYTPFHQATLPIPMDIESCIQNEQRLHAQGTFSKIQDANMSSWLVQQIAQHKTTV